MLYFSCVLAGFTLGVFTCLKVFSPDKGEDIWDPQNFPVNSREISENALSYKANQNEVNGKLVISDISGFHLDKSDIR